MILAVYGHNWCLLRLLNYIEQRVLLVLVFSGQLFGHLVLVLLGGGVSMCLNSALAFVFDLLIFNLDQHLMCLCVCGCYCFSLIIKLRSSRFCIIALIFIDSNGPLPRLMI